MNGADNFYTSGGTLGRAAKSYVTRPADQALLAHLLEGEFCYVLTSRQMGKSSLMVRTADALRREGVKVSILDLTRVGQNVTVEQWYDGLLVRLGADLGLADEIDEYWISDRVSRFGPMQRFMGVLREVVLPAVAGNVALFIDEIDAVRSLPFSSDEFFAGIRECYNSRVSDPEFKRISFCLLGVAQPSDLISNVYITPFNIGHRIELTDFTETDAEPLLIGLREKANKKKGAEAVLRRILYWTGGHPYLTQKLCETVVHSGNELTPKDVDLACEGLFLSSRSREQQDNLIFVRDRVLASKEHRSAILDLYEKVRRGERVRDDDSNATIGPLRLSGLIVVSKGILKVRNRIYATVFNRAWVIANMPDAELRRQRAAYRRGIMLALTVSLPILAVIGLLSYFDWRSERSEVINSYFTSAASAQDAFNAGDYRTGRQIVALWSEDDEEGQSIEKRLIRWWQGRSGLDNSFAMRLLRAESEGESNAKLRRQDGATIVSGQGIQTSCGAELAVASTVFRGLPLVAAAGEDSSIQIWRSDKNEPFAHVQLVPVGSQILPEQQDLPLKPCSDVLSDPSKLIGIMSLSFSPDGSKLAIATGSWNSADSAGSVLIWNMDDRHQLAMLPGPDGPRNFKRTVDSIQFSPDGQTLAASSEDETIVVWHWKNGQLQKASRLDPNSIQTTKGAGLVGSGANAIALTSEKDHLLAVGYGDGHLLLYDYLNPEKNSPIYSGRAHVSGIMSMAFLEQKTMAHEDKPLRLVVGSRDGDLLLLDPQALIADPGEQGAGAAIHDALKLKLQPGQGVIQGIAVTYNPDRTSAWLLISGSNSTIGLWSTSPIFQHIVTLGGHTAGIHAAAFCQGNIDPKRDPGCIASASSDGDVRLWMRPFRNATEHHLAGRKRIVFPGQMVGVAFPLDQAPDAAKKMLVTAVGATTEDNLQHAGLIATWQYGTLQEPLIYGAKDDSSTILTFDVSPDAKFVVSDLRDGELNFLNLTKPPSEDHGRDVVPAGVTLQPGMRVRCLKPGGGVLDHCASDQRDYLVFGVADGTDIDTASGATGLCVWHVRDNGASAVQRFSSVADQINPCMQKQASQPGSTTDTLHRVGRFDISDDGRMIVTSSDAASSNQTCVEIWSAEKLLQEGAPSQVTKACLGAGNEAANGFDSQFTSLCFSHDGQYLAAVDIQSHLYFWPVSGTANAPAADKSQEFPLAARGSVLAFSPHGYTLAVGLQDARVILWNTLYHRSIMEFRQNHGGILGLAFSSDGDTLATAANDGMVNVMQSEHAGPK